MRTRFSGRRAQRGESHGKREDRAPRADSEPGFGNEAPVSRVGEASPDMSAEAFHAAPSGAPAEKVAGQRAARRGKPVRTLRGRAIAYLSRREHSRSELERKLAPYLEEDAAPDTISQLLDALTREGWLSERRFAESVLNRKAGRYGTQRVVAELRRNQVDAEVIDSLSHVLQDSETSRAQDVWRKKFGRHGAPETPQDRARQARFLASRGFSFATISHVLRHAGDPEADSLEGPDEWS